MHANFEGVLENFGGGVRTPLHPPRKSAPDIQEQQVYALTFLDFLWFGFLTT